ncbi:MAG TPA: lipoprotein insertase outer membrane protein LolB [Rudaea sp.]|jgi:outer membrane lipoprotein LolB|uniref:lipoprotein insertase outer membrane protein LolB n=1 Tax=Rudaea sp. TaxID=2136325 RepID=UPI002F91CC59
MSGALARVRLAFAGLLIVLLTACVPMRVKMHTATPAAQDAREAALASRTHWTLDAHIAVSTDRDSNSGELDWRQAGESYVFTVRGPITGKTLKLTGDAQHAVLEGVDARPSEDSDVQRLLRERIGWDVPLASLRAWVRGLRAQGTPAQLQYNEQDLPALIEQDGWKIEYRDWFSDRTPALPRIVFASHGTTRVKMAIETWSFDE